MFSYCIVYTILSALASFIVGDDLNSYSLRPKKRLLFVLYSVFFFFLLDYWYCQTLFELKGNKQGIFGSAFQFTVQAWCLKRWGPVFITMFHPIGIVISTFIGFTFLGDGIYLGRWKSFQFHPLSLLFILFHITTFCVSELSLTHSHCTLCSLLGSVVVVIGFYSVMWGKAKEKIVVFHNEEAPLLQNVEENITSPSPWYSIS